MGIVVLPSFGADPVSVTGPTLDAKVDGLGTEFNGNIDNDNIKSAAAIANSKLNLAAISQNIAHSGTMTHSGTLTMTAKDISEAKGADVASATTTTIWVTDGNFIHITGTTTITGFGTAGQAGDERTIVFDGILTLTHNATSLILPTGANITTAAGDTAIVRAETTANARVIAYLRKDGTAVAVSAVTAASQAEMEAASNNTKTVTPLAVNWNPGVAKAWVLYNTVTSTTITASLNVTSLTDNGTGDTTVNFTTAFSSANFCAVVTAGSTRGYSYITAYGTGTVRVLTTDNNGASLIDQATVNVACFGDQ